MQSFCCEWRQVKGRTEVTVSNRAFSSADQTEYFLFQNTCDNKKCTSLHAECFSRCLQWAHYFYLRIIYGTNCSEISQIICPSVSANTWSGIAILGGRKLWAFRMQLAVHSTVLSETVGMQRHYCDFWGRQTLPLMVAASFVLFLSFLNQAF